MYILAVAMDQLTARLQLIDLQNNPVAAMATVDIKLLNNDEALPTLIDSLNDYVAESGIPKSKIAGIGIGMPGFINAVEGINYTYMDAGGQSTERLHLASTPALPLILITIAA
jgi:predicted NBD/HSP70 family sugar kinase